TIFAASGNMGKYGRKYAKIFQLYLLCLAVSTVMLIELPMSDAVKAILLTLMTLTCEIIINNENWCSDEFGSVSCQHPSCAALAKVLANSHL
ncbi:hypothetical protein U1Q18_051394, partial [Sarracenia purpurea var. burkii]